MIPSYKPYLTEENLKYAKEALDSTWISSTGDFLTRTQERLQDHFGVKHVLLTNNGTAANHLLAKALKFKHPNINKIIVPNNVYIACWNAMMYDKNYKLIPVDTDPDTWNFDLEQVAEWYDSPFSAIFVVHNLGNVVNVPSIRRATTQPIIEDNCEGIFGSYENRFAGTDCLASSVSFFGNKNITCGEGGGVMTNDTAVYEHLKNLACQGQSNERWVHNQMGYNYRMTNVQAAILYGQMDSLDEILEKKETIFDMYRQAFAKHENISYQTEEIGTKHSNWLFGVRIHGQKSYEHSRAFFDSKGIEVRPLFYPISKHPHTSKFADRDNEVVAQALSRECVLLPSYPLLSAKEQKHIIKSVVELSRTKVLI